MTRRKTTSTIVTVKNALRPFFHAKKTAPRTKQFNTIRHASSPEIFREMFGFVEQNPAFKFPGLGNTFPTDKTDIPDSRLRHLTPLAAPKEVAIQTARLNHYSDKLRRAVEDLARIDTAIMASKHDDADELIAKFNDDFGFSAVASKRELYLSYRRNGHSGLNKQYHLIIDGADRSAWAYFSNLFYNIVDPSSNLPKFLKSRLRALGSSYDNSWYASIVWWAITGFVPSSQELARTALRFNAVSLIDLLFFLWEVHSVHGQLFGLNTFQKELDVKLFQSLKSSFSNVDLSLLTKVDEQSTHVSDANIYRTSFFFTEYASVSLWRSQLSELLFADGIKILSGSFERENPLFAITPLLLGPSSNEDNVQLKIIEWIKPIYSGLGAQVDISFLKTLLTAQALRTLETPDGIQPDHFIRLLSDSPSLFEHVEVASLKRLQRTFEDSEIIPFLISDLIFRRERTQDNDLERRASFMMLFGTPGRHGIIPLLDRVGIISPSTAIHIADVCTRPFLEKLYLLMSSVKDVIETRLEICQWIEKNSKKNLDLIADEKNALERELANLDARSDLDSTRVHVDEEALREWYNDTQYGRQARYIQTVLTEGPEYKQESFLSFYNRLLEGKSKESDDQDDFLLEAQIGSQFILLEIIEATLRTFASDRSFGLDAYLSRRIRHGTLSGFLLTPITRLIQKLGDNLGVEDQVDQENKDAIFRKTEEWRTLLVSNLDVARREHIQLRSNEHPKGLINPTWRTATGVTHLDALIKQVRARILETRGAYDIFPDIHSLCWDLVQTDLARVRLYLYREFFKQLSDILSIFLESMTYPQKSFALPYFVEINRTFMGRIQEVCGWFIRPVVRRDRYDLGTLVSSLVSIIRELDVGYDFSESISIEKDIEVNRGTFEVLGDLLFVLIGNAAKHGKKGGKVRIIAQRLDGEREILLIKIVSETGSKEHHAEAVDRINNALKVKNIGDLEYAAVAEGFTGIRKMIGLLTRIKVGGVSWENDINSQTISFILELPFEITFKRERA